MRKVKRPERFPFPIYPILFGLYPVLYLWSANRVQQPGYFVVPSLLATLAVVLFIYLIILSGSGNHEDGTSA